MSTYKRYQTMSTYKCYQPISTYNVLNLGIGTYQLAQPGYRYLQTFSIYKYIPAYLGIGTYTYCVGQSKVKFCPW